MSLVVSGISHHTSDVDLRERLTFPEAGIPEALAALREQLADAGAVILSTCNRSEIYVNHAGEPKDLHHEIRQFISQWHNISDKEFDHGLFELQDKEAVGHLFRVASSLDSLVVGEGQILGQVHDAYIAAHQAQATDKVINALFQKSFTVAKKIRTNTRIGEGKVSISSVAVDLAVSIFMDLSGKTVLVVGSGEMGELTLKSLVDKGAENVLVANRTLENAESLAKQYNGEAIALSDLEQHLHRADIVISSTGATGIVLDKDPVQRALKKRAQTPMVIIDIAVPRDVDSSVNELDNAYLYDIDGLQKVADQNMETRRDEIDRCLEIIDESVDQFHHWMQSLIAEPTIVSLSKELHAIRIRELEKTLSSLDHLEGADKEEVEYLTKRIVNNILQQPMTQIKQEVHHEDHSTVLQLVRRLFGLKEST
jgi:glutamyl-tRNA reductase